MTRHLTLKNRLAEFENMMLSGRFFTFGYLFLVGALLSRAQAPTDFFPAIFIAFPLLYRALLKAPSAKSAFWRGWSAGFGYFLTGLAWIGASFQQQSNVPAELAPFAILGLTAFLGLYTAFSFWLAYFGKTHADQHSLWGQVSGPMMFASSWIVFECLRAFLFTGFPWNLIGTIWANWLWVAQTSAYISIYGLGFVTILAGLLPQLVADALKTGATPVFRWAFPVTVSLAMVGSAVFGGLRISAYPTQYHDTVTLRLVQANVAQRDKWRRHLIDRHFDNHLSLSRQPRARRSEGTRLLIWPEVTVQYLDYDREGSLSRYRISRALEPGSYALVGSRRLVEEGGGKYKLYNSMFATNTRGDILGVYDKRHLVPFGEYLPLAPVLSALGLEQLTGGRGFTAGDQQASFTLKGIPPFEALICYETIFPGAVTQNQAPDTKTAWLLNISNDAWFGASEGPYQHLAQARMRAIEEGLPIVRSTGSGVSAIIDPLGRIVASLPLSQRGILDHTLPQALPDAARPSLHLSSEKRYKIFVILAISLIVITLFMRKKNKDN